MISRSHNFIFVHIPKTGGTSLQGALLPFADDRVVLAPGQFQDGVERFELDNPGSTLWKHSAVENYRIELRRSFFRRAFKFSIVRNPWDRLISAYFFRRFEPPYVPSGVAPPDPEFDADAFSRFVRHKAGYGSYLCDVYDGTPEPIKNHCMNRILKAETLQADFDILADELGIARSPLQRRNATFHRPYPELYTPQLQRLVADMFAEDIEYFGYKFGG